MLYLNMTEEQAAQAWGREAMSRRRMASLVGDEAEAMRLGTVGTLCPHGRSQISCEECPEDTEIITAKESFELHGLGSLYQYITDRLTDTNEGAS